MSPGHFTTRLAHGIPSFDRGRRGVPGCLTTSALKTGKIEGIEERIEGNFLMIRIMIPNILQSEFGYTLWSLVTKPTLMH